MIDLPATTLWTPPAPMMGSATSPGPDGEALGDADPDADGLALPLALAL